MGMNPDTNRFEMLTPKEQQDQMADLRKQMESLVQIPMDTIGQLLRPNGEPVPKHWSVFRVGEDVVIKDYTFRVVYIGEGNILFEPVGPVVIEDNG
jgi:hypothetical protein